MPNEDSAATNPGAVSRRKVLRGAAGLGAAGLAAGIVAGSMPATAQAEPAEPATRDATTHTAATPKAGEQPVVAHVRDASTGQIDLYVGTRHVQLTDPQLAARLTNAAN